MIMLERQIRRMRELWPRFEVTRGVGESGAVWFGTLVGVSRPYRVAIEYVPPAEERSRPLLGGAPVVRVLSPALRPNWYAAEEAPLPHVYFTRQWLELSPLCLFDPDLDEWTPDDFIAETTVPWAADWLACYEGWRATGRWLGGGRHADSAPSKAA